MITKIFINGFKSFQNFEMTFTPLTIVAGSNASGKSNLFDALKLLSQLAEYDLKMAFSNQRGNPDELFTYYGGSHGSRMDFEIEMLVNRKVKDNWGGEAVLNNTRLRYKLSLVKRKSELGIDNLTVESETLEKIKKEDDKWVSTCLPKDAKPLWKTKKAGGSKEPFIKTFHQNDITTIKIRQDGRQGGKATPANAVSQTVLGGINSVDFPHAFAAKEELRSWKFLQLNPEYLREPTPKDLGLRDTITQGGENLAAALFRIYQNDPYSLKEISRKLNKFLPNYTDVKVYDDQINNQFIIKLTEENDKEFSSRVLSEGTLRLLALCILEQDEKHTSLLCFEEPENGIHPFRMKAMAQLLKDLSANFQDTDEPLRQIIVNTHSPVLVSEMLQWKEDKNVSVWFSRLSSLIDDVYGKRVKTKITRMSPVYKETDLPTQLSLFQVSNAELKLTLSEVVKYLQSADTEAAIRSIK